MIQIFEDELKYRRGSMSSFKLRLLRLLKTFIRVLGYLLCNFYDKIISEIEIFLPTLEGDGEYTDSAPFIDIMTNNFVNIFSLGNRQ